MGKEKLLALWTGGPMGDRRERVPGGRQTARTRRRLTVAGNRGRSRTKWRKPPAGAGSLNRWPPKNRVWFIAGIARLTRGKTPLRCSGGWGDVGTPSHAVVRWYCLSAPIGVMCLASPGHVWVTYPKCKGVHVQRLFVLVIECACRSFSQQ